MSRVRISSPAPKMKTIQLPIYKRGKSVIYKNSQYTIDYVHIRYYDILIKLHGVNELVDSTQVTCGIETFLLHRGEDQNEKNEHKQG